MSCYSSSHVWIMSTDLDLALTAVCTRSYIYMNIPVLKTRLYFTVRLSDYFSMGQQTTLSLHHLRRYLTNHTPSHRAVQTGPKHRKMQILVILSFCKIPRSFTAVETGQSPKLFAGKDHVIHFANVKTASGAFRRSVIKLSPVPFD